MKRSISVILVILIAFSLFSSTACSSDKAADSPTVPVDTEPNVDGSIKSTDDANEGIDLTNTLPKQYVSEKLKAGLEVTVVYATSDLSQGTGIAMDAGFKEKFTALGINYAAVACDNVVATQIEQIENYVTLGAAAIIVGTSDPDAIQDCCTKAEEAGTAIVFFGTLPNYEVSGTVNADLPTMGYQTGMMARAWIDSQYPDSGDASIGASFFCFDDVVDVKLICDNQKQAISEDPRCYIVNTNDSCTGVDNGYTFAEQTFTMDPDSRLFVGFDSTAAVGINNYISSIPDINWAEYGIFIINTFPELETMLAESAENKGALRGSIMGGNDASLSCYNCVYGILFEDASANGQYNILDTLQAKNSFDYLWTNAE